MRQTLNLHFSAYHEKMEKHVIHRNYFFPLWIFVTFATNSEGTWTLSFISFIVVFQYIMTWKKNLIFPSLLLKSFQPRIDWQLFLRQLHDKWIFLPEYLQYWAESYSRRKRLWLRLSRNSFMFFLQCGRLPWCQRQTSLRTPALGQV